MPGPKQLSSPRVVHKSTGGTLNAIPEPVDPVGNAPSASLNTVAHPNPCASSTSRNRERESEGERIQNKTSSRAPDRWMAEGCGDRYRYGHSWRGLERRRGFGVIPRRARLASAF